MDVSVPPIVRGEFMYRDTLLVDVGGDLKRHPRASEAELKTLLDGTASKDQVGHWYEAQLIHYGLQRSKEKNAAKVRLQQALNQGKGKLKVPPHIADMEVQMKKDYAGAVRKAKALAKSTQGGGGGSKVGKRKNDEVGAESSKRTKIAVSVGDITINIEQGMNASAAKKSTSKASLEKPVPKKTATPKQNLDGANAKARETSKSAESLIAHSNGIKSC
ncbi:hypothetical protein LTR36_004168 [Oleoguttula mirabilis]|uniref:Uncharacterized protein n=1 Tax=Oleoguttula mirabilis TaxID=1507867 RepID=A0AAV9JH88_9PEZI|nr:hypothetical protein LTR36_004168 [Oleoguttula mirabilis]